jgi:carotenoid phi-ring synthase / carotenoid chi-ring synthase
VTEIAPDVIVIGGGLSGLTAALHLAEEGLSVRVLEADPRFAGGRISAKEPVEMNGWSFPGEHGVHGIWSPYINLQAMLSRHRIRPVFVPAQEEDWIYRRGNKIKKAAVGSAIRQSWIPAPFHYLNLFLRPSFLAMLGPRDWLSLFSVWTGLLFAVGIDPLREDQPLEGLHMSYLLKGWSPALRAFFIGLARSGLSGQPDEIPLSGFIAFLRFYTVLRRDAWAFSYLPSDGGTGLIDPMVGRLNELGGSLELGKKVTTIERTNDGWQVLWESTDNTGQAGEITARSLILATDAPNTEKILRSSPDIAPEAANLVFPRGMTTAVVRLWFDRAPAHTSEGGIFSGDFILDNFFWLDRLQEPYMRWRRATGGSAIEAHIYGPPALLAEPDAALLARAISDVQAAFPELRGHKIYQVLQRNDATHTLFGLGPVDRHLGTITPWPGIFCCGDWVRHNTPALFLERAVVTGMSAANAVLEGRGIQRWPILDHPEPESFVGGIEKLMKSGRRAKKLRRREMTQ